MFESSPDMTEIITQNEKHKRVFYESRFNFLKAINGIRPACLHGLLAPTSMGKTTLIRSVIADTSKTAKTGLILSEEKFTEYAAGFVAQGENVVWENLKMLRESNIVAEFPTKEQQIKALVSFALEQDIKVLFWDNITTGTILGDSVKPDQMAMLLEILKHELFINDIALFFIAHTNKTVKAEQTTIFQGEDVRGSNQYFMKADYFFNLQLKTKDDEKLAFVNITKNRFHQPKFKYFVLEFVINRYTRDIGVNHAKILEIFEKDKKNAISTHTRRF